MYADDLVIFSTSSIGLRALITVCEEYAVSHEMVFNHKKSVILICRSKYMKNVYPVFTLNFKIIDESDTVRYLGHILCNRGKDDKDITRQCQQLYARGNVLLRKVHMCSMSLKIQLFNTYCSPMYTAQLWWNHTVASYHRLNVAYNNVLRRLLRRPRFCSASGLFVECRIPNCKAVIRNLIFRFMTRLDLSKNSIISTILVSDIRWTSRIRRHWVKYNYCTYSIVKLIVLYWHFVFICVWADICTLYLFYVSERNIYLSISLYLTGFGRFHTKPALSIGTVLPPGVCLLPYRSVDSCARLTTNPCHLFLSSAALFSW